jgi:hypothetical protein
MAAAEIKGLGGGDLSKNLVQLSHPNILLDMEQLKEGIMHDLLLLEKENY